MDMGIPRVVLNGVDKTFYVYTSSFMGPLMKVKNEIYQDDS